MFIQKRSRSHKVRAVFSPPATATPAFPAEGLLYHIAPTTTASNSLRAGQTFTANNSPTTATGKVNATCTQLTKASSQYFNLANDFWADNLRTYSGDFSGDAWIYLDSLPTVNGSASFIAGEITSTGNQRSWGVVVTQINDKLRFLAYPDGTSGTGVVLDSDTFGALSVGTWYHVAWAHEDGVGLEVWVNGVRDFLSHTGGVYDGTGDLYIGSWEGTSHYMDGRIDEVRLWNRLLTDDEVETNLYNGGDGLIWTPHSLMTSLKGAWECVEKTSNTIVRDYSGNLDSDTPVFHVNSSGNVYTQSRTAGTGPDRFATLSNSATVKPTADFSVEVWFYLTALPSAGDRAGLFVGGDDTGSARSYRLYVDSADDIPKFAVSSDGTAGSTTEIVWGSAISINTWYHVVATHEDGVGLQLIIDDGTPVTGAHTGGCFEPTSEDSYLANDSWGTGSHTPSGRYGPARLWHKKLTAAEITHLYNSGSGRKWPFAA